MRETHTKSKSWHEKCEIFQTNTRSLVELSRFVTTYKTTSVNVKKSLHIQVIDRNDTLYDLYFEAHILDRCTNLSWGQKVHTTKP